MNKIHDKNFKILLADIGNSRAKFAVLSENKITRTFFKSSKNFDFSVFGKYNQSVVSTVVKEFKSRLASEKNILLIDAYIDTGIDFNSIDKKTIGSDRVAGAVAAAKIAKGDLIFIDSGTAITVNAVSAEKRFLGGVIMPGLELLSRSLFSGTSALPKIKINKIQTNLFIGNNTKSAITAGLCNLLCGGLEKTVKGMAEICDFRSYSLIVTGGNGQKILEIFPKAKYIKNLNLLGLWEIWKKNYEGKNLWNKDRK